MIKLPFALRSADSSSTPVVDDPLAMPAAEVDTRFPRLQPDRIYRMNIASSEKQTSEKGHEFLVVVYATTKEEVDTDGKTLHPGFKFFQRTMISTSGERDSKAIAKDLAIILQGVFGKTTKVSPRELINSPEMLLNKIVDIKVGMNKAKDGYPESNKVSSYVPPSA